MIDPVDSSSAFAELHAPDDSWMERIRLAEAPLTLGRLGDYELLAEISRGGQGIVYRARQPGTHRDVALKRLLAGAFATRTMRQRFEREIEAAAALNHNHIVTVYGSDVVDDQPLLTMEWIEGVPVTQWSAAAPDGRRRATADIVGLFRRICDAVSHAHQRGVIHRDLKPSNILVDASDQPHVLDFGLAKWTTARDTEASIAATAHFVGTVAYAAPEQLLGPGGEVDVRSDVYSLGVMFYEMLTGTRPYDLGKNLPEAFAAIQHTDPPRPSRRTAGLSSDLEAIVLKALEKDPRRRYQSVDALVDDLDRHERGEAVRAHPPSTLYHLRKLVGRNRTAFASAAGAVLLLAIFAAAAGILWRGAVAAGSKEADARRREQQQRAIAENTTRFLVDMLASADPYAEGADRVTVRAVLDRAAEDIDAQAAPQVRSAVHHTIGLAYLGLGVYPAAEAHLRSALDLRRTEGDATAAEVVATLNALGWCLTEAGRYDQARAALDEALQLNRQQSDEPDPEVARTLYRLGRLEQARGDYATAETLLRESLEQRKATLGADHEAVAESLNYLGEVLYGRREFDDAKSALGDALEIGLRTRKPDHPETLVTRNNLAAILLAEASYDQAEAQFMEILASQKRIFGEQHPYVAAALNNLGMVYQGREDYDTAERYLRQALGMSQALLDAHHPVIAQRLHNLARQYKEQGRYAEAEELLQAALDIRREAFGEVHRHTAQSLHTLGEVLLLDGRPTEAEPLLDRALEVRRRVLPENHWHIDYTQALYGACLTALNRFEAAEAQLLPAYEHLSAGPGEARERSTDAAAWLVTLYDSWGKPDRARVYRDLQAE